MRFAAFVTDLRVGIALLRRRVDARFLVLAPRFADDLRVDDFRAEDFFAEDFFAEDLRAPFLAGRFALDLRAADLRPPDFPALFLPLFEPPRDDFLAAMLRAPMLGFCCDTIATSAHKKQQEL